MSKFNEKQSVILSLSKDQFRSSEGAAIELILRQAQDDRTGKEKDAFCAMPVRMSKGPCLPKIFPGIAACFNAPGSRPSRGTDRPSTDFPKPLDHCPKSRSSSRNSPA